MSPTLEAYREAKSNYMKLRNQAKKELIARFHELAGELLSVQKELLDDFGEKIALPSKPSAKKTAKQPAKAAAAAAPAPAAAPSPKVVALQKQLDKQKQKLADLQAAGKPSKTVEDRIYEIEDEIRLAGA